MKIILCPKSVSIVLKSKPYHHMKLKRQRSLYCRSNFFYWIHVFHSLTWWLANSFTIMLVIEVQPRTSQTYRTESHAIIINGIYPLTIVAKLTILVVCRGPGYPFDYYPLHKKWSFPLTLYQAGGAFWSAVCFDPK